MSKEILALSRQARDFPLGIYKHYKGKEYEVLGVGFNESTLEEVVIYKAQYGKHHIFVRSLNEFVEEIDMSGNKVRRFSKNT
ncbi:MAG: DUF1653 domain-containing protein [Candidatus Magasanikbacteria bacterium]|mgnify:FL=1|nr:DUF1653 domain-containing protein [Candidatus Magasanikbacteria bacterium]